MTFLCVITDYIAINASLKVHIITQSNYFKIFVVKIISRKCRKKMLLHPDKIPDNNII